MSVPSVHRPSVTLESRADMVQSKYFLHSVIGGFFYLLKARLCNPEFRGSLQMSALNTGIAPLSTTKIGPIICHTAVQSSVSYLIFLSKDTSVIKSLRRSS